jgi:hypothetical protein
MGSQLPNGKQQFVTILGTPLVGGKVYFYEPGTETPKTTYQDSALTIPNTNPVVLDSRGQAVIWGSGTYRQVLVDVFGVQIWDQIVEDIGAQITGSLADPGGSALVGFLPGGTSSVTRTVQDKLRDIVSVKDFGAKGDGSTDDTEAIRLADGSNIAAYYFPPGTYCANNLVLTKPFDMDVNAVIKYNGSNDNDVLINFNGNNVALGRVNVDGNSTNPLGLFTINGNGNTVEEVNAANQTCPADGIANGAVKFLGNGNIIKRCTGENLTNGGNANVSLPQLLTFGGASNQNTCEILYGNNIRAGIVGFSTGTINYVGHAEYTNINDNGCYMIMGYTSVKTLRYDGADEVLVSIGGGGDFGTVIVTSAGGDNAVVGINNSNAITIGEILLHGPNSPAIILRSRGDSTQVCAPLKIGRIAGGFFGNEPFFLDDTGKLDTLSIDCVDITHFLNANSLTGSWSKLDAAQRLNLGKINIKVVDTTNGTGDLHLSINPGLSYPSIADTISVSIFNSDGITPNAGRQFFADNFFQPNMSYVGSASVHNVLASIQKSDGTLPSGGGLFSSAVPTGGTWKRGQHIWRSSPNAGATPGWVCVASGTPGTWVQMALLQNS